MGKFDILESKDVYGDNRSKIFDKYGTRCSLTDFAILTGGYVFQFNHTKEGTELKNRTCCWWLKTFYLGDVFCVDGNGYRTVQEVYKNSYVVRPFTKFSSICKDVKNIRKDEFGIEIGEYGMYPNSVVDEKTSYKLEKIYSNNGLQKTGKKYKTDNYIFDEYKFHGNRYVRVVVDKDRYIKELNDGTKIEKNKAYWLKVEAIEWFIDREKDMVFPKRGVTSDVAFDKNPHYYGVFEKTNIKKFLDEEFEYEILPIKKENKDNKITYNDVLNYKYKNAELMTKEEKQKMFVELLKVDQSNFESARSFVSQMGDEYLKIFDALWECDTNKYNSESVKVLRKNIK